MVDGVVFSFIAPSQQSSLWPESCNSPLGLARRPIRILFGGLVLRYRHLIINPEDLKEIISGKGERMITEGPCRRVLSLALVASLIAAVAVSYGQTSRPAHPKPSRVAIALSKVIPELQQKTSVPLRLPTRIPALDNEQDLYAIVTAVEKDRYVVVLGATPDCEGQHVCTFGTAMGASRPLSELNEDDMNGRWTAVRLTHGIKGRFRAFTCAAYCGESVVSWSEGKYHYAIGMKAEKKAVLISIANSAIDRVAGN